MRDLLLFLILPWKYGAPGRPLCTYLSGDANVWVRCGIESRRVYAQYIYMMWLGVLQRVRLLSSPGLTWQISLNYSLLSSIREARPRPASPHRICVERSQGVLRVPDPAILLEYIIAIDYIYVLE